MNKDNPIRDAIDESLSGIHFDVKDMHSVMRAVRSERPCRRPRRALRPDLAFACAMTLLIVAPLALFALRAQGTGATPIVSAAGISASQPDTLAEPHADLILSPEPAYTAAETEAVRIARACFEENCDTDVFSFEEYAVSVAPGEESGQYAVLMESIYGNGCSFTVVVSVTEGCALRYSTPRLATVPTYLDSSAPEIKAWYDKNGPYLFTWPQEEQAEFSRRYEGSVLRAAQEGEMTAEEAALAARTAAEQAFGLEEGSLPFAYPVLYAERSGEHATYVVYCTSEPVVDALPEAYFIVSLDALTGETLDVSEN